MYTSAQHPPCARIRPLALLAALAIAPVCGHGEDLPQFSNPGTLADRGHFVQSDGASLYRAICQGCHMADARGAQGAGMYPALAANPKLASAAYPALTVLQGRRGMPAFAENLSDQQVAEVVNYVRGHFDNHFADSVTPGDVARLRASLPAGQ
ncbi:MAG TPA: cytochrome c [Rudaea sp.]|nr:cytochrome c [Rudaea sp.]HSC13013.1 cytochrome c [Rhodanobacteraceae bacterium]